MIHQCTEYKVRVAEAGPIPPRLPRCLYNIICPNRLPRKKGGSRGEKREAGGAMGSSATSKEDSSDFYFLPEKTLPYSGARLRRPEIARNRRFSGQQPRWPEGELEPFFSHFAGNDDFPGGERGFVWILGPRLLFKGFCIIHQMMEISQIRQAICVMCITQLTQSNPFNMNK